MHPRPGDKGRSPRVRGRLDKWGQPKRTVGSIPAGAGETWHHGPPSDVPWVDPRGCGGDIRCSARRRVALGRSPRVRGRREHALLVGSRYGSIPAGAGETRPRVRPREARRVDPRGCGGDTCTMASAQAKTGRSPRVRGRHRVGRREAALSGSIPAGAGETWEIGRWRRSKRVDPRGCGGDISAIHTALKSKGRSPRVRGRRHWRQRARPREGSIPAGAGETPSTRSETRSRGGDPRGCGGDAGTTSTLDMLEGRSPRVRGRQQQSRQHHRQPGSIPAGAGET